MGLYTIPHISPERWQKNKGRISRYLANKCSIASRIDCFSEYPTTIFGDAMKQQVEDRLKFYETGELPRKNVEVMGTAVEEATVVQAKLAKKAKKKKKKAQKGDGNASVLENGHAEEEEATPATPSTEKKKKKKRKAEQDDTENVEPKIVEAEEDDQPAKKKKKKAKKGAMMK